VPALKEGHRGPAQGRRSNAKGEKRSETADKDRQFTVRYYGRFERRIRLGVDFPLVPFHVAAS
jgi:hypothetical protein